MPENSKTFGVYEDGTLCFAFQTEPGAIKGIVGGVVMTHPQISGKIHSLPKQSKLLKTLEEQQRLSSLIAALTSQGYQVLETPQQSLSWAL